jgi:hypothetical protein
MIYKLKKLIEVDEHGNTWIKGFPVFIEFGHDHSGCWMVSLACASGYSFDGCNYHSTDIIHGYDTKKECEEALVKDILGEKQKSEVKSVTECDCGHHVEWSAEKNDWVPQEIEIDINGDLLKGIV